MEKQWWSGMSFSLSLRLHSEISLVARRPLSAVWRRRIGEVAAADDWSRTPSALDEHPGRIFSTHSSVTEEDGGSFAAGRVARHLDRSVSWVVILKLPCKLPASNCKPSARSRDY
jgi:hypothetical protein